MYFRTKTIKGSALTQLVQSYRNEEGLPRQRVIASLGDALLPENEKKLIAQAVEARLHGEQELCELMLSDEATPWVDRIVQLASASKGANNIVSIKTVDGVLIDQIETENVVQLGPQLVAIKAWEELGFGRMLGDLGMNASQIATAQLMISNRLIEPLSEWALIDWAGRTALPEMLDISITKSTKNRLYQMSDKLYGHRRPIEKALRKHEKELFGLKRSIILYDVTNTHFEGLCQSNAKAKHGKNKQKRNDCRQVAVGMAFDEYGFPLANEIFEGNMADTKTLEVMLDRLAEIDWEGEAPAGKPVVILDAGFASKENLALLKTRGYSWLINITRGSRSKYAEYFEQESFVELPGRKAAQKVEVKKIADPEDEESHLLLCRSAQRRKKEVAMISNAEQRFLKDAEALGKRIKKGGLIKSDIIERRIGAVLKKHPRVARFYTLTHQQQEKNLLIERQDEKMEAALDLCGDYVLKTDQEMEAGELWELYMTLLKAEAGFKMLKGALGLRPNYHQLEERVEGHIFISILAYHLLNWVHLRLQESEDNRDWKSIRRLLITHSLVSTRLPLEDGRVIRTRKPSVPDAEQALVYKKLGIDWRLMCPATKLEMK